MAEAILMILALIPTMLGISELIYYFKVYIIFGREVPETEVLLFLCDDDAISKLKHAGERKLWYGKRYAARVYGIYSELSQKVFEECEKTAELYNIKLLNKEEFYSEINSKTEN